MVSFACSSMFFIFQPQLSIERAIFLLTPSLKLIVLNYQLLRYHAVLIPKAFIKCPYVLAAMLSVVVIK